MAWLRVEWLKLHPQPAVQHLLPLLLPPVTTLQQPLPLQLRCAHCITVIYELNTDLFSSEDGHEAHLITDAKRILTLIRVIRRSFEHALHCAAPGNAGSVLNRLLNSECTLIPATLASLLWDSMICSILLQLPVLELLQIALMQSAANLPWGAGNRKCCMRCICCGHSGRLQLLGSSCSGCCRLCHNFCRCCCHCCCRNRYRKTGGR